MKEQEPNWPKLPLAPTLSPLMRPDETSPRAALERISASGFRLVQLSSTHAGLRPRDLDASARREMLVLLRRCELTATGLDSWIPIEHFADAGQVDRAMTAAVAAIELAADLGRLTVSLNLPDSLELVTSLVESSHHHGVLLADHAVPVKRAEGAGVGIDPVTWMAAALDPVKAVQEQASFLAAVRLSDLLKDGSRGPIGKAGGRLNVPAYRLAIDLAGFRGAVVLDARQWANPWAGVIESREAWLEAAPFGAGR